MPSRSSRRAGPGRARLALLVLFAGLAVQPVTARGEEPPLRIAVLPFEIRDSSGEELPPEVRAAKLAEMTELVRRELEAAGLYAAVPGAAVDRAVADAQLGTYLRSCNGCEIAIARELGADRVMVGWVNKVSRLVLSMTVRIEDVASGRELYLRAFDFRGDTLEASEHAVRYMVRALARSAGKARPPAPKPAPEG